MKKPSVLECMYSSGFIQTIESICIANIVICARQHPMHLLYEHRDMYKSLYQIQIESGIEMFKKICNLIFLCIVRVLCLLHL